MCSGPAQACEKERRLLAQPPRAAIAVVVAAECVNHQLFEPFHLLQLPAQVIVEAKHLAGQPRPHLKRQPRRPGGSLASSPLHDDVALERREAARRRLDPRVQPIVELVARHDIGTDRKRVSGADLPSGR